jgi:hypothetical protein
MLFQKRWLRAGSGGIATVVKVSKSRIAGRPGFVAQWRDEKGKKFCRGISTTEEVRADEIVAAMQRILNTPTLLNPDHPDHATTPVEAYRAIFGKMPPEPDDTVTVRALISQSSRPVEALMVAGRCAGRIKKKCKVSDADTAFCFLGPRAWRRSRNRKAGREENNETGSANERNARARGSATEQSALSFGLVARPRFSVQHMQFVGCGGIGISGRIRRCHADARQRQERHHEQGERRRTDGHHHSPANVERRGSVPPAGGG